jgi:hypothetical protein
MTDINRLRKLAGLTENIARDDIEDVMFGNLKKNRERDTDIEHQLFLDIKNFIASATPSSKGTAVSSLSDLRHLKSQYPDDLTPNANVVFRGTQFKQSVYDSLLEKIDLNKSLKWITLPFNYAPRSNIQSWTTSKKMAGKFACQGQAHDVDDHHAPMSKYWISSEPFPAIIEARVDESFILSTKLTSKIAMAMHGHNEREIIRIDQSPIQAKALIHIDWLRSAANMRPNR